MKFFDAFCGIGGFSLGIHRAFEETQKQLRQVDTKIIRIGQSHSTNEGHSRLDNSATGMVEHFIDSDDRQPTCVGYSEINKYANSVYERHFGEHKSYGDITKINTAALPDFDILVGGFPCQAFSIAGRRAGFEDTRGTLFFELARILKDKQPSYFVFENVKGIISHDVGHTFRTIIETLDGIGYDLQWQVLNSKHFGVPQNRERVFIIGHLRGKPRPEVFPFRYNDGKGTESKEAVATDSLVAVGTLRTHNDGKGFRQTKELLSPTVPARAREDGSGQPVIIVKNHFNFEKKDIFTTIDASYYKGFDNHQQRSGIYYSETTIPPNMADIQLPKIVAQRGRYSADGKTEQQLEPRPDNVTNTLTTVQKDNMLSNGGRIRRLTPLECERLQGFPDNWTQWGKDCELISDSQRYRMCGNAVTVNVIQDIFTRFFKSFGIA